MQDGRLRLDGFGLKATSCLCLTWCHSGRSIKSRLLLLRDVRGMREMEPRRQPTTRCCFLLKGEIRSNLVAILRAFVLSCW